MKRTFATNITYENAKRARSANFTTPEKEMLISLVAKYASVVECKKTDAVSTQEKAQGWENIQKEFSAQNRHFRPASSLKKCWMNLKRMAKMQTSQEVFETFSTGGGTPDIKPTDAIVENVMAIIGQSATKFHNPCSNVEFLERCSREEDGGLREEISSSDIVGRCSRDVDGELKEEINSSDDEEPMSQVSECSGWTLSQSVTPQSLALRTDLMPSLQDSLTSQQQLPHSSCTTTTTAPPQPPPHAAQPNRTWEVLHSVQDARRSARRRRSLLATDEGHLFATRLEVLNLQKALSQQEAELIALQIEGQKLSNKLTELQIEKLKKEMEK